MRVSVQFTEDFYGRKRLNIPFLNNKTILAAARQDMDAVLSAVIVL